MRNRVLLCLVTGGLVAGLVTGCASAPLKNADLAALAAADAKVLEGCYDCLLSARDTYARLAVGKARPLVVVRLFETTLLVAVRERELALDAAATLAAAQAIVSDLPPTIDGARLLAIAAAIPPDATGTSRRSLAAFRRAQAAFLAKGGDEMAWVRTALIAAPVREYLALSIDCAFLDRPWIRPVPPPVSLRPRDVPDGTPPLLAYRLATCGTLSQPVLYRLRESHPHFTEVSFFLARFDIAVAGQNGPGRAREYLAAPQARFPTSPLVTYTMGSFHQSLGDCREALGFYERTLTLSANHENALLGRIICLSHGKRHDEAIARATEYIVLRPDNVGEGYYWRAWNKHVLTQLTEARADIEEAKKTTVTVPVLALAGIIEHDQDDLPPAHEDLMAARQLPYGDKQCSVTWYLGLVELKRKAWLDSGRWFEQASTCYLESVRASQLGKRAMEARADIDPQFRAQQLANFDELIREDTRQHTAAAFNAANYYATGGSYDAARRLVEVAAKDPSLAEKVAQLRAWLKDKAAPYSARSDTTGSTRAARRVGGQHAAAATMATKTATPM